VALCCLAFVALLAASGCSGGKSTSTGSSQTSATVGANMAGAVTDVHVTAEALADKPQPWVLTTPESAVRSYLDWTSYAYRIATSDVASPTMGPDETVRVDSYIQYNLQKNQVIDQTLASITFGTPSVGSTSTLLPAKEKWTYRYVSIKTAGKTVGGPYSASYDTVYTVAKSATGVWQVFSVKATPQGTIK
jgi:hypothetical protein